MWELDYKESWAPKNWCFWTVVLEKTLESPLEIQSINPKGNQSWVFIGRTDVEAETPILWPPDAKSWLVEKDPDARKDWRQEKGMTEDEMAGWHHRLDEHEFEQALGVGDGQRSLVCCSPGGCKESDTTEWLNWTESLPVRIVAAQSCPTLCNSMDCSTPGSSVLRSLPEFYQLTSIESVMLSSNLILCWPLLLLPSILPSIRVFSNDSALCITRPMYTRASASFLQWTFRVGFLGFQMPLEPAAQQASFKVASIICLPLTIQVPDQMPPSLRDFPEPPRSINITTTPMPPQACPYHIT